MEDDHKSEVASPLAPLEECTLLISELVHSFPWFSLVQCHAASTMNCYSEPMREVAPLAVGV